jgi:hypothetical protein
MFLVEPSKEVYKYKGPPLSKGRWINGPGGFWQILKDLHLYIKIHPTCLELNQGIHYNYISYKAQDRLKELLPALPPYKQKIIKRRL